jgi:hypothetical protein
MQQMKRTLIAGLATAALLSGGLGLAGLAKPKDRPSRHVLSRTSKDIKYEEDSLGKRVEILGLKLRG